MDVMTTIGIWLRLLTEVRRVGFNPADVPSSPSVRKLSGIKVPYDSEPNQTIDGPSGVYVIEINEIVSRNALHFLGSAKSRKTPTGVHAREV